MEKKSTHELHGPLHFLALIVTPAYQIMFMAFFAILVVSLFWYAMATTNIFEKRPGLEPIIPKELKERSGGSSKVQIGLHINDFPTFDIRNRHFVFDAIIWFLFDQSAVSLKTVEKFSFPRGTIQHISAPDTKLIGGNYFVRYEIRVDFKAELNQKYFPFDDHRLYIEIANNYVTPDELIFASSLSSFLIAKDIFVDWSPVNKGFEAGFTESELDIFDKRTNVSVPKIIFYIDFSKVGTQDIFLVFLPLLLMVFMGLFAFGFNPPGESSRILTLSMSSVTGMLAYRFVLQNLTPRTGYFILSDCFFFLFLALVFAVFCMCLVILRTNHITKTLIALRGMIFLSSYAVLVIGTFYFLFYWPYQ